MTHKHSKHHASKKEFSELPFPVDPNRNMLIFQNCPSQFMAPPLTYSGLRTARQSPHRASEESEEVDGWETLKFNHTTFKMGLIGNAYLSGPDPRRAAETPKVLGWRPRLGRVAPQVGPGGPGAGPRSPQLSIGFPFPGFLNRSGPDGRCQCRVLGSGLEVDCSTLTSKCLLFKALMRAQKGGRALVQPSEHALVDNDGLYDPDCDQQGRFKPRQCNQTSVCWCVNSVGVRRTDKGDLSLRCDELVRTHHILIDLRRRPAVRAFNHSDLDAELRRLFWERYLLHPKFVAAVHYEHPTIQIELQQNTSQKVAGDVDIADAAYYFERDVKGESLFPGHSGLDVRVRGEPLLLERTLIYYLDEKSPQFSMKRLTSGLIAVIVVVLVALVAGVAVLVITNRRKLGKYKKVEIKELGEMRKEPSL
ncbi:tumor-associated calcium signal transducer 2 [Neophocaena asiaeorientalis asiaeorientalis]|uniref:Tumor-associated calcium signal transducer 2 n=1 Tax=Neophocaena asiaeorientalis asiaeorientalis TaxID=1706337 RepID=A0A341CB42_NEOAA|nr:tumor-associated calcium signal transducer 2 [Neophocaena asiaeorientalis asiaeorientalis]